MNTWFLKKEKTMIRVLMFTFLMVMSLLTNGCKTDSVQPKDDGFVTIYRLKAMDPLFIRFSGIQEQQQLEVTIDQKGYINLLHIKEPIKAAGLTTTELEDKIEKLYIDQEIYKNVSLNITMTDKNYYVQGQVNRPGKFQLTSGTTLLQAIADAGGTTAFANKSKVTITRHGVVKRFDLDELEKDPSKDIKIEQGDVIKVYESWI